MLKFPRRKFLYMAAGAAALPAVSRIAQAQAYPTRPIRLLVGYSAGGPTDITARLISQYLSMALGQSVVIDNRPGASATLATQTVVSAANDGYTLILLGVW